MCKTKYKSSSKDIYQKKNLYLNFKTNTQHFPRGFDMGWCVSQSFSKGVPCTVLLGWILFSHRRVCQDLGHTDGKAVCCSAYGTSTYYIGMYQTSPNYTMQCRGTERKASECLQSGGCLSGNYASVVCFNDSDIADESELWDQIMFRFTSP